MISRSQAGTKHAVLFAISAGIIFGIVEIAAAALTGHPPLTPLRMFASVIVGRTALIGPVGPMVVTAGCVVHLVLSAIFGLIFKPIAASCSPATRASYGKLALVGLAFGAGIWLFNFELVVGIFYPWFPETPAKLQLLIHAVAFGLPLALMYSTAQRRVARALDRARPPTPSMLATQRNA